MRLLCDHDLAWQVARQQYDSLSNSLRRDSVALLAEVRSNVQEVKAALKVQSSSASRLSSVEARLSSLEGSLLSTGMQTHSPMF